MVSGKRAFLASWVRIFVEYPLLVCGCIEKPNGSTEIYVLLLLSFFWGGGDPPIIIIIILIIITHPWFFFLFF